VSVEVAAPAQLVFRLARDVERWPRLLPHYVRVRAIERRPDGSIVAEMVARRPLVPVLGLGLPVAWRSRTWSDPASLRLHFVHIGGATDGMDVTWRIEPTDTGSRVSIDHDFRARVPGWAWFVDRVFTRPIASRTLATFKAIAEALATDESGTPSQTIHPS
jgi:ribosome-associated toxin RatA of RatAB toxin-antitoxin module